MAAKTTPVETAQRHENELSQQRDNDKDEKETKEMLKTLDLSFAWASSNHATIEKNKTDLKICGRKFWKLTNSQCCKDPPWVLSVLQRHAPHLQVLHLYHPRREHLQATVGMPRLRELVIVARDSKDSNSIAEIGALPSQSPHTGLDKLRIGFLAWPIVVTLLKAHRLTLQELRLDSPHSHPGDPLDLRRDLAAQLRITLPNLRKLTVTFPIGNNNSPLVNEWETVKDSIDERYADVLAAVRHSLEEIVLTGARWKHLDLIHDLPQLRKLKMVSMSWDEQMNQADLRQQADVVDKRNAEDQDDATVYVELPVSRDCEQDAGLRTFWSRYYHSDARSAQVTQRVLVTHRRTLEEVDIGYIITPEHLQTIQQMPRLRTLRLKGCCDLEEPLTVVEVKGTCVGLNSITTDNIPNAVVVSLLSLHAQSLEEVRLLDVTREQLLVVITLPKLLRLQLKFIQKGQIHQLQVLGEPWAMRLERLEVDDLPAETSRSLLAASRDTLQEVKIVSVTSSEVLQELQRMPALRNLHIQCFGDDDLVETVSPLPNLTSSSFRHRVDVDSGEFWRNRRRFDVEKTYLGLPKQAPNGVAGMQLLHVFAPSAPPKKISYLLAVHSRTLEDVCLVEATRDQLLVTLRMPRLRRLQLHDVRWDLLKATQRDVPVGKCNVEWMRLGKLPLEVIRWLLFAHRHGLRHLELNVINDASLDEQRSIEDDMLWPPGFGNLHRLIQHCELKRLETLVLIRSRCRSPWDEGRCQQQLAALSQVLPGRMVRCSQCDDLKDCHTL